MVSNIVETMVPIVNNTRHRSLPANSRSVDVANRSLSAIADVQRLKYHNAFLVNPHPSILYRRLTSGLQCSCANRDSVLNTRLNQQGNATPGFLNHLLSGGLEFGDVSYGRSPADSPDHNPFETKSNTLFSADQSAFSKTRVVPGPVQNYDSDSIAQRGQPGPPRMLGNADDLFGDEDSGASTVVSSGKGPNGIVHDMDWQDIVPDHDIDSYAMGHNDTACPFCFGSGFVGGYAPYRGFRRILNHQDPGLELPGVAEILFDETPVSMKTSEASFRLRLPYGAVSIESLQVWNGLKSIPASISVDGRLLHNELGLQPFCDGQEHVLTVSFWRTVVFTHVELQLSQSNSSAFLAFPKITRGSMQTVLENMDDVQLLISPTVPMVQPGDYVAESIYGKVFQIKSVSQTNAASMRDLFGWEADARPLQPKELATLLPKGGRVFPSLRTVSVPVIGDKWRT